MESLLILLFVMVIIISFFPVQCSLPFATELHFFFGKENPSLLLVQVSDDIPYTHYTYTHTITSSHLHLWAGYITIPIQ